MDDHQTLIDDIEQYCRAREIAETTFGRRAVNDGKFVGRLRAGKGVTTRTLKRVQDFLAAEDAESETAPVAETPLAAVNGGQAESPAAKNGDGSRTFRFYDNRQKYLTFVNTCSEKWVVAERVGLELAQIHPRPPAIRVFDAGMGDGTVLARLMRDIHRRYPTVPLYVVGKEISLEDARLSLEKMSDRFFEHPATVLVVTNLNYAEAPWLMPGSVSAAAALNWHEVALRGSTAYEFDEQIRDLQSVLSDGWRVRTSKKTGNPLYERPSVLVLYREDHRFIVDPILPRPGHNEGRYDLIVASQPYRATSSVEFKAKKVLAPLARALAPGGRMLGIHSHGHDPGLDIIQKIWPERELGQSSRHLLMKALKAELGNSERDLRYNTYSDARSLFRYEMHTLPSEINASIGTSTLFAAWNAAIYVYQIEDDLLSDAMSDSRYLEATQSVLQEHGGLWFVDESFVVSRKRD
ncbi:MAG: hypothetical protein ACI8S3_002683 [Alphaproteobacteria bacterium]|jgi:hypothetical protein